MAKKRKSCGITTGVGKRHKDGCPEKKSGKTKTGLTIDGATPIPNLLTWQAQITEQLKLRKATDVKKVKEAIAEIGSLETRLAKAKELAGV